MLGAGAAGGWCRCSFGFGIVRLEEWEWGEWREREGLGGG